MNEAPTKFADSVKFLCLFEELESSRDLIKAAFGHLQEIDMGNTFYHLPHQLMASGLERFMKCYVLLIHDGQHGSYPDNTYAKHLGHDLQKLLKLICTDFYGGTERAWVRRELHFVTTDSVLQDCIRILSLFGKKARYYNLDVVSGVHNPPIDPKAEWTALESSVEDPAPFLQDQEVLHRDYYPQVHSRLIAKMERLVRALAMQLTLGGHDDRNGTIGRLSSVYTEFRSIRDEELGTTDYRRSVHILRDRDERNWIERSDQEIEEGGYPIRTVTRDEFEGDWPFSGGSGCRRTSGQDLPHCQHRRVCLCVEWGCEEPLQHAGPTRRRGCSIGKIRFVIHQDGIDTRVTVRCVRRNSGRHGLSDGSVEGVLILRTCRVEERRVTGRVRWPALSRC